MRYLITFACYGGRLHGDGSGSVDRKHNLVGSRLSGDDRVRVADERESMKHPPYSLASTRRGCVLESIHGVRVYRPWNLLAAHIRMNHVHAVVEAGVKPERMMNDCKAYASQGLNRLGLDAAGRRRWAHHGSTRWLNTDDEVRGTVRYVVEEQGERMALFVGNFV